MKRKVSLTVRDLKIGGVMVALALALAAIPGTASGQDPAARAAQAAFERFRIARLPWSREPGIGRCDEIVGRFCYRHEAGSDRTPPAEPAGVAAARDTLLARLDRVAEREPADGWTAGQRVRYRLEAGQVEEAVRVALTCRAEPWWCAALEAAARHAGGDYVAAERAFDRALAAMPDDERASWNDLSPILDGAARRVWRGLGPGGRDAFARRLWWAADPLWSVPGNERRSEHFARLAWDRMQVGALSPHDVAWGADLRELLVRYGWPVGWERARDGPGRLGDTGRPGVVAHDPPGAKRFEPSLAAIADPAVAGADEWRLEDPAPRATYAPSYARTFLSLAPQIAAFRRGAETILAVGWSLPADALAGPGEVSAAVLASEGPDRSFVEARATGAGSSGALSLRIPWPRAVVGVEVLGAGLAARWRAGLELPGARPALPALSDLLLLEAGARLPASLEEALPLARRAAVAAPGERLGVFWEAYPRADTRAEPVTIALAISPRGGAELRWSETLPAGAPVPRAAFLRLPDLPSGEYVLELTMAWPDGAVVRARRPLSIRR